MAILITPEAIVKTVYPKNQKFDIDSLNDLVRGWIEPLKIGPLWVMYKENPENEPLNQIASMMFNVALRGDVLVVPVQQLPSEWDLMDENESQYTGEEVDMGFLVSLQNTLSTHELLSKGATAIYSQDGSVIFDMIPEIKEEWMYDPDVNKLDENTKAFFRQLYPELKLSQLKSNILYEDEGLVVRVSNSKDMIKALEQMIQMFVVEEEYEKCASLQKNIEEIQSC